MKHLKVKARPSQCAELLPSPAKQWRYVGHSFLGGLILPDNHANELKDVECGPWGTQNVNVVLGTVALASAGWETSDICDELFAISDGAEGRSHSKADHVIAAVCKRVGAGRRYGLLPALLREGMLRLTSYGNADNFRATPYELTKLGLVTRGVNRAVIAEACQTPVASIRTEISRLGIREGVPRTGGCASGAIMTRHLGATSCVPLLHSAEAPGGVIPLMPVTDWEALVVNEDVVVLRDLFSDLAVC